MRNHNIDKFKTVAAIMVVVIHSTVHLSTMDNNFWFYQIYRYALDIAVVYFFAVTGYFIAEKDNITFIKKQIEKTFSLFISSSIIYLALNVLTNVLDYSLNGESFKEGIKGMLYKTNLTTITNGTFGSYHLWYLASLFWALCIFYLFIKCEFSYKKILIISFSIFIVFSMQIIDIGELMLNGGFPKALMAIAMGYAIYQSNTSVKIPVLLSLTSISTYTLFNYYSISNANVIFLFLSVYFILLKIKESKGRESALSRLSKYSMPLYIMHPFVISVIRIILKNKSYNPLATPFVYSVVLFISSLLMSVPVYHICCTIYKKIKKHIIIIP